VSKLILRELRVFFQLISDMKDGRAPVAIPHSHRHRRRKLKGDRRGRSATEPSRALSNVALPAALLKAPRRATEISRDANPATAVFPPFDAAKPFCFHSDRYSDFESDEHAYLHGLARPLSCGIPLNELVISL